ncbi:MAG: segregation and condensation protein A [Acutalibacteraceae bacterium]|nr:segregation/condensation protein A [Bacillota bacterium]
MEKISYKLEVFEGPLDLLLYLISKNKLNIYDIPVAELLEQYMEHIDMMRLENMDVSSEFLTMASRLVYIKTAMLMPRKEEAEELKKELSGELIEYQLCKQMAGKLAEQASFDGFTRKEMKIDHDTTYSRSHSPGELLKAYINAVGRGMRRKPPSKENFRAIVGKKIVSVTERIGYVLKSIYKSHRLKFSALFEHAESRSELIATFLAVLDLIRNRKVNIDDNEVMTINESGGRNWNKTDSEQQ